MTIKITGGSLSELFRCAATGPFMQAEIASATGLGKLRVTCNWLYSALNCDPSDASPFVWEFSKLDDQHISLSPAASCIGQTLYASVRDDYNWLLQVQAPFSADWITAARRDETIGFALHGLLTAELRGFNGAYITLNGTPDSQGGHAGYRLASTGSSFGQNAQWIIAIKNCLQSHIEFSPPAITRELLEQQLRNSGISPSGRTISAIARQLNLPEAGALAAPASEPG